MRDLVSGKIAALTKINLAARQAAGCLAMGLILGFASVPVWAEDMPEHEHAMDHSTHEHHHNMMAKPGGFSSSVAAYTVPDVKMVSMDGGEIVLRDVLNGSSPIILNFIFTSCTTICPVMSATFQQVQQQLGSKRSNVRMVSISIDPENDTPAKLKAYAGKFGAGAQWKMLTGSLENSIAVQKAFGVFAGDKMDQKPVTFLKAKGSENSWVRLEGLVDAHGIIKEFDKLKSK